MTDRFYVVSLLDGAYMLVESDEKPDPRQPLIWRSADGKMWGVPEGRYKVTYGPCSEGDATEFILDVMPSSALIVKGQ